MNAGPQTRSLNPKCRWSCSLPTNSVHGNALSTLRMVIVMLFFFFYSWTTSIHSHALSAINKASGHVLFHLWAMSARHAAPFDDSSCECDVTCLAVINPHRLFFPVTARHLQGPQCSCSSQRHVKRSPWLGSPREHVTCSLLKEKWDLGVSVFAPTRPSQIGVTLKAFRG